MVGTEKTLYKIYHPFRIKTFKTVRVEENLLDQINDIYKISTVYIILIVKILP